MPHHAVLISAVRTATEALAEYPFSEAGEVFVVPVSNFGIDEVRALAIEASRRPREGVRRLLVVVVASLTHEAQQALLKLLEEPPATTSFLFVVPPQVTLLPTLASRFYHLPVHERLHEEVTASWREFVGAPVPLRLDEVTKRLAKKDTAWVEAVKVGLKDLLAVPHTFSPETRKALQLVLTLLGTRGASNKLLLEELALTLPSGLKV